MKTLFYTLFGDSKYLNSLQMGSRAFIMFFITLALIRIAGMRTFGQKSAFDAIIVIMLGAILSRAVAGASDFIPTVTAGLVLALIHRIVALGAVHSKSLGFIIKGEKRVLYIQDKIVRKNMRRCCVSEEDLMEEVRLNLNASTLDNVKQIYMERSGKISIIQKQASSRHQ